MKEVTFKKDWRGHHAGDTAELTDARAEELAAAGYLEGSGGDKKPPAKKPADKQPEGGDKK